ncbi:MAG: hypothetical protein DRP54_03750 [Spirochaetes bacterium]|nr:MAG: hypothetical protein DRP54_03750 [Spirochaetota bacterium]
MISGFIIMFRESLEAILIIGVITAFLIKTRNQAYLKYVLYGASEKKH